MIDDYRTSLAPTPAHAPRRRGWRGGLVEQVLALSVRTEPVTMLALLLIVWIGLQVLRWMGKTF